MKWNAGLFEKKCSYHFTQPYICCLLSLEQQQQQRQLYLYLYSAQQIVEFAFNVKIFKTDAKGSVTISVPKLMSCWKRQTAGDFTFEGENEITRTTFQIVLEQASHYHVTFQSHPMSSPLYLKPDMKSEGSENITVEIPISYPYSISYS